MAGTPKTISDLNGAVPPNPIAQWPVQPQSELVQAVNVVARAVTARISVLQAEINALRNALAPFKQMGSAPQGDMGVGGGDDAVAQLLDIARKLGANSTG